MAEPQYTEDDFLDGEGPDPRQAAEEAKAVLYERLDALGMDLAKTRAEAIEGRETSGIEQQWREDEEYYEGIDDANRHDNPSWRSKPLGTGGVDTSESKAQPTGSTVFPNITRPYCDAASARASDMLLPTDDVSWGVDATPVPEIIGMSEGALPRDIESQIQAAHQDDDSRAAARQAMIEQAKEIVDQAKESANKAQQRIQDWHIECQYHAHVRSMIESAAKIGCGVLKGPFPAKKRHVAYKDGKLIIEDVIKPVSVFVDPWNFYPDPGCGENIHNGSYTWERDDITHRRLEDLKGTPGYISEQIDKCLKEGPHQACRVTEQNESGLIQRSNDNLFEIWYGYCNASRADLRDITKILNPESLEEGYEGDALNEFAEGDMDEQVFVQVTLVNNRLIRMVQNPLDTGEFPYDVMPWQKRKNHWAGIGVGRQVRVAQNIIKAGFRSMMDNGGQAAGPQVLINTNYVRPQNNIYEFVPWKIWLLVKDLEGQADIDRVFRFAKVDMAQAEMENIINLGLRLAEDATGFPMIMQGQTNSATPTTLGGMQLQDNNASTVLRRIARLVDDCVTEPHVRRYYNYLLQYGPDDSEKGEFVINAMGSSALVERDLQNQQIGQMANMVSNPVFGLDPKKWAKQWLKSNRLDVNQFEFDDDEWRKVVERMAQPPQDSAMQVAQIREEGANQREQMKAQLAQFIQASKENIEERKLQVNDSQFTRDLEFKALMAQVDQDVIAYQENMAKGINDDNLKTRLAETVLKLRPIYQDMSLNANQLPAPPTEPAGRAQPGRSYTQ